MRDTMSRELHEFSVMIDDHFEVADIKQEEGFWDLILVLFI
jgi:hypothetical protein